jgi:hypothetical protein
LPAGRAKLDGQLQETIVGARDPGRIYTAIAQLDQDVMTLEAARAGFSQKQADVCASGRQRLRSGRYSIGMLRSSNRSQTKVSTPRRQRLTGVSAFYAQDRPAGSRWRAFSIA